MPNPITGEKGLDGIIIPHRKGYHERRFLEEEVVTDESIWFK